MKLNLLGAMALSAALTLGFSSEAMADSHGIEGVVEVVIEEIGIGSFDDLYSKVKAIDTKITNAADDIASARKEIKGALNTIGGGSLEDAVAEFKAKAGDMIKITGDLGGLKIGFDPEAPEDIQKVAGALNNAVAFLDGAKTKLGEVPGKMTELSDQAAAMADPKKLKKEAKNAGIKMKEVPGLLKKVKSNNEAMKVVPSNSKAVVGEADKVLTLIKSIGS